jgi:hypothetical protein
MPSSAAPTGLFVFARVQMIIDYQTAALIIVDVQNDFCPAYTLGGKSHPEGSLAVAGGGEVCVPRGGVP